MITFQKKIKLCVLIESYSWSILLLHADGKISQNSLVSETHRDQRLELHSYWDFGAFVFV